MNDQPEPKPRDRRALNAYRHGLTGQIVIHTPEDQVAYDRHCRAIQESLAPLTGMESELVQSICDNRWRLKRAAALENSLFALGIDSPPRYTAHHEQIDAAFAQAVVWLKQGNSLALLTLYENRIRRHMEKDMADLRQLQEKRQAALQKAVEEANLLAQLAASEGEPYDIERDFPPEALPAEFVFSLSQIARLAAHARRLAAAKKQFPASPKPLRKAA
jgi:hypothetical protein